MDHKVRKQLNMLLNHYPKLCAVETEILKTYYILESCYRDKGKLLIAGNGGSAADAEHIVGELMKSFKIERRLDDKFVSDLLSIDGEMGEALKESLQCALPAMTLNGQIALTTAYSNDCNPLLCFAQQVNGYGNRGDVFWGISTSGNSSNILYAAIVARAKGLKVVGLTGEKDNKLSKLSDVCIKVPEVETYLIQELHLPIYHCLCSMLEESFFGNRNE